MPRADLYSKKMGELLLKGWRMLGEDCPLTGEVPLMQHPTSGRKFSIAAGQYTDEMDLSGSGAGSLLSNQSANGISPQPATQTNGADATAAPAAQVTSHTRPPPAAKVKTDSDRWSEQLSVLMLKGWKMLGENCPATGKVPLMQHPSNGRKFSVAADRYVDEMIVQKAGDDHPNATTATTTKPPAPPAPLPTPAPAPAPALAATPVPTTAVAHAVPATPVPAPAVPVPVPLPVPLPVASGADSSHGAAAPADAHDSAEVVPRRTKPVEQGSTRAALDSAIAALRQQLIDCTALLARAEAPAPQALVDTMTKCADAICAMERARATISGN